MRKIITQSLVVLYTLCLFGYGFYLFRLGGNATDLQNNLWWVGVIVLGAMIRGFLFTPMTKASFPNEHHQKVKENPDLKLEDHEIMAGHYGFAALVVFIGALIISPLLYGRQTIFEINSWHFIWAVIITGCLNVGIFYFYIKSIRYGDLSRVTVIGGLAPILMIPISYLVYFFLENSGTISSPNISLIGFLGIVLIVSAIIINALIKGSKKKPEEISTLALKDWFARHPMVSALLAAVLASFGLNFDKVAIDSSNPFLAGTIFLLIVATITLIWIFFKKGWERIKFLFKNYLGNFVKVGFFYGLIIITSNIALFGNNINYVGATKRISIVFASLYGIFVLREGITLKHKIVRFITALLVVGGIFLITLYG